MYVFSMYGACQQHLCQLQVFDYDERTRTAYLPIPAAPNTAAQVLPFSCYTLLGDICIQEDALNKP